MSKKLFNFINLTNNKITNISFSKDSILLSLAYWPPYDFHHILKFIKARLLIGIEHVTENNYFRAVQIDQYQGWIRVTEQLNDNCLLLEISDSLKQVILIIIERVYNIFDLKINPQIINSHLAKDPLLAQIVINNPGLRVAGAFDGFELAIRAILGQQISVKAANNLMSKFIANYADPIIIPCSNINFISLKPKIIAKLSVTELTKLGIIQNRAKTIIKLAELVDNKQLDLNDHNQPIQTINQLLTIAGIGPWTAHYIAMHALGWRDAFPKEDIILRKALGAISAKQAEILAQAWQPWRSYATIQLWNTLYNG